MVRNRWRSAMWRMGLTVVVGLGVGIAVAWADQSSLPNAKPLPDMQVLPLPYDQASFQYQGQELTRYHFGPSLKRPFLYPLVGPEGRSLTRMGHPRDPVTHGHHHSVWVSHGDVGGVNFWDDRNPAQIVCQRIEQYEDGPEEAWLLAVNAWLDGDRKPKLIERRRVEVRWLGSQGWFVGLDIQLEAPANAPVTLGQTPFGVIGVRMAKSIGVHDGGGRILNSAGQVGEAQVFRQPARWVDYSGPVTHNATGGLTLLDHPSNPDHPTPFHVRDDGWMGASLTLRGPRVIEPGRPLRLRYGLWAHAGVPTAQEVAPVWEAFVQRPLPPMQRVVPTAGR